MSEKKKIVCKKSYNSYKSGCRCIDCKTIGSIQNKERNSRRNKRLPIAPLIEKLPPEFRSRYRDSIRSWEKIGITLFAADRICCQYGFHPWVVYGDIWYWDINEGNIELAVRA